MPTITDHAIATPNKPASTAVLVWLNQCYFCRDRVRVRRITNLYADDGAGLHRNGS